MNCRRNPLLFDTTSMSNDKLEKTEKDAGPVNSAVDDPQPASDPPTNVLDDENDKLAPFNPTCEEAQSKAIDLLGLKNGDVLFDLGCGDARLLMKAATEVPGLLCVGVELDPVYVARANDSIS